MKYSKKTKEKVKVLTLEEGLNALEISKITGITQKTLGVWIKEIKANQIREQEQKAIQEQQSIKALILQLKEAKWQFINQVDAAIENYIKLNS